MKNVLKYLAISAVVLVTAPAYSNMSSYTLINGTNCSHAIDLEIYPKTSTGTVQVDIEFRDLPSASQSCNITGVGRSCSVNIQSGIYYIKGAFEWSASHDLIKFNGDMIISGCAHMNFSNAIVGIVF
ncbi:MAG: hypothetical protein OQL19_17935 [Gammaproteobacteria bacterium]|nr:hypothetical protein [Gammaproteobacteria bacterium]